MSQNTALVKQNDDAGAIMERVLIVGDLQQLTPDERCRYYNRVCESLGLNPLTRPFDYLKLNGKLQLYAKKDATEQLRKINRISIYKIEKEQEGDLYTVTAYGRTADGREDVDMGATTTKGLSGDNLVNARLKAVTKAKRRLTLSMSGLGFLDETEIETIPQAQRIPVTVEGEIVTQPQAKVLQLPQPVATISETEAEQLRELGFKKGYDLDTIAKRKRKPQMHELTPDGAKELRAWLEPQEDYNPDANPSSIPTGAQETLSVSQQQIKYFWGELSRLKIGQFNEWDNFEKYLEANGIELNVEINLISDIPDEHGDGYAKYLANSYDAETTKKDDPLM